MYAEVSIQEADFDLTTETDALRQLDAGAGAIAQFIGVMRDLNDGDTVLEMELEHYPGMTERCIQEIIDEAGQRWPIMAARVIHRVGRLSPKDKIVFVAVSAPHRHDAFQACEFIMDFLKTHAPFWKKERLSNGESRWVDARSSDDKAMQRWQNPA